MSGVPAGGHWDASAHHIRRSTGSEAFSLEDLAQLRTVIYRLFSQALSYPTPESLSGLVGAATALKEVRNELSHFAFYAEWETLAHSLKTLQGRPFADVQSNYVALFAARAGGLLCPPYESSFLDPQGQSTGWLLARLEGEYAAAKLVRTGEVRENPDHISIELDYLAVLCDREAKAWSRGSEEALRLMRRERSFIHRHLGAWIAEFVALLWEVDRDRLYAKVADTASKFVVGDKDLLETLLEHLEPVWHEDIQSP